MGSGGWGAPEARCRWSGEEDRSIGVNQLWRRCLGRWMVTPAGLGEGETVGLDMLTLEVPMDYADGLGTQETQPID